MHEDGATHAVRFVSALVAVIGLIVFYIAAYLPSGASLVDGDRARLAIAGISLLITVIGLFTRHALND